MENINDIYGYDPCPSEKKDDCNEHQCHGVDSFECSFMYLTFNLVLVHS
jgi:hypothetical protein